MGNERWRFTPVTQSKRDVRRVYARLSHVYDLWGSFTESKAVSRALQLAGIEDGERVLEVAVGTGRVFEQVVAANAKGWNEGIDMSPEMLARARKRMKRSSNYGLEVADAYSLPYADGTFDLIINNYMFDLLPEQDFLRVLMEFKRVLKAGGRIVVTSMTPGRTWYSRMWDRLVRKAPNILSGCRPVSLEEDAGLMGFENVHVEYVSQLTFPSLVMRAEKP